MVTVSFWWTCVCAPFLRFRPTTSLPSYLSWQSFVRWTTSPTNPSSKQAQKARHKAPGSSTSRWPGGPNTRSSYSGLSQPNALGSRVCLASETIPIKSFIVVRSKDIKGGHQDRRSQAGSKIYRSQQVGRNLGQLWTGWFDNFGLYVNVVRVSFGIN